MSLGAPRKPREPRRRAGKIQPSGPFIMDWRCWLCGRPVRSRPGSHFGGKFWCWRHHPLRPRFGRQPKDPTTTVYSQAPAGVHPTRGFWGGRSGLGRSVTGTSDHDIERHQRKVDAILGRKKRKAPKPRKQPRDRVYRR